MRAPRNRQAGLTTLEVVVSASVASVILLAAIATSRSTVRSLWSSVNNSESAQRLSRLMDGLALDLEAASESSLTTTPSIQGAVPEPLQDSVEYSNLQFRKTVGFSGGQVVYQPSLPAPPCQIWVQQSKEGNTGELVYFDGTRNEVLARGVVAVGFVKEGHRLFMNLYYLDEKQKQPSVRSYSVYIRSA